MIYVIGNKEKTKFLSRTFIPKEFFPITTYLEDACLFNSLNNAEYYREQFKLNIYTKQLTEVYPVKIEIIEE